MGLCCLNGEILPGHLLQLDAGDRGLTLGDGVFDTLMFRNGEVVDGEAHFLRLQRHAAILGSPCPWSAVQMGAMALRLSNDDAVIRTQLTRGPGARGLLFPDDPRPTLIMRALPVPPLRSPPRVLIAKIRRNETSPLSRIKSTNYLDNILALNDAVAQGFDDALLLNTRGYLACASAANVFVVKGGDWTTPPLTDGALDGVTRARVMHEKGAREESISLGKLLVADEIWLTNSVIGLLRVKELKG